MVVVFNQEYLSNLSNATAEDTELPSTISGIEVIDISKEFQVPKGE